MRRKNIKVLLLAVLSMPCAVYAHGLWGDSGREAAGAATAVTANVRRAVSLDSLFALADEQSVSMRNYRTAIETAEKEMSVAMSGRLPDISGELSAGYLGDGILSDRKLGDWQHVDNPHFMNGFALKAQQVIYSGGAIQSSIDMARMGRQMAALDLEKSRQEIRFVIASCYLDLCRLQNRRLVIEKNMELNRRIIEDIRARYAHGTSLKTDITRYELEQKRLELEMTKTDNETRMTSRRLAIMLHMPDTEIIEADITTADKAGLMAAESEWQTLAGDNNNIRQAILAADIDGQKVRMERASLRPKIAAIAEMHFDGPITIEVPVIDKNFGYWFAGVGVSYDISSLFKGSRRLSRAKTAWRHSREKIDELREETENAVQTAYTDYETAVKNLEIQRKSVELAEENYAVVKNRYDNGLAILTDMLDASSSRLTAGLGAADAEIDIIFNKIRLKYISHTL
ncbi:MAG: TolC family protein [Prevotella sp.]